MNTTRLVLMIAVVCGPAAVSEAQPVEVGVSVGTGMANGLASDFGAIYGGQGGAAAGHVTLPVSERFAIQPFVSYGRRSETLTTASG
jgi:hypothetical protein